MLVSTVRVVVDNVDSDQGETDSEESSKPALAMNDGPEVASAVVVVASVVVATAVVVPSVVVATDSLLVTVLSASVDVESATEESWLDEITVVVARVVAMLPSDTVMVTLNCSVVESAMLERPVVVVSSTVLEAFSVTAVVSAFAVVSVEAIVVEAPPVVDASVVLELTLHGLAMEPTIRQVATKAVTNVLEIILNECGKTAITAVEGMKERTRILE